MVNKIDGNNYSAYTKPQSVNIPNTGEKFSLDHQKDELSSELKDKKEKEVSDQEKQQAAERGGVRIELSSKGVEKQKQAQTAEAGDGFGLTELFESIKTFFTSAAAAVKDIFGRIWNDPQPTEDSGSLSETTGSEEALEGAEAASLITVTEIMDGADTEGTTEGAENFSQTAEGTSAFRTDEEKQDREIRRHLQNGDMTQVIRLLTDNGRKTAARNSTLLTYYDKNGRVVEPDPSIRERTLFGDRNTRKL